MPTEKFANSAVTTLNGGINNAVTSLVVTSATLFPTAGQFRIKIDNEIMIVTNVSGTTFTVTRGAEGTSAASHSNSAVVRHVLTAGALTQFDLMGERVAIDSNAKHAYLCNDTSGSTLADVGSTGGSPLTLNGTANTAYWLASGRLYAHGTKSLRLLADTNARGATATGVTGLVSGSFTVEAFVIFDTYITSGTTVNLVAYMDDGTTSNAVQMGVLNTGNIFAGTLNAGSDKNVITAGGSTTSVTYGMPTHLMYTYSVTNGGRVYKNGLLVGGTQTNGTLPAMTRLVIGNRWQLDAGMRGVVADVRYSTGERTAAEALAAAEAAFSL